MSERWLRELDTYLTRSPDECEEPAEPRTCEKCEKCEGHGTVLYEGPHPVSCDQTAGRVCDMCAAEAECNECDGFGYLCEDCGRPTMDECARCNPEGG